jgi:ubiquinone/menaquinone biosynthesis C-methylase UbiE
MGWYSEFILPRLCDVLLDAPYLTEQRRQLLRQAWGNVLEIGFGSGLNLPHYPAEVDKLIAVDPNVGMRRLARARIQRAGIAVDQRTLSGERLPFTDGEFDCVVSTFTLCSIEDVRSALGEAYRVLRGGGRLLFLEHGLSPDPKVQRWQHRLSGLQMRLAGGCRLDRPIKELIADQPFAAIQGDEFYLDRLPRTHGYIYRGIAQK